MWVISNKQFIEISQSIRDEFERRANFILSKEFAFPKEKMQQIINKQIERTSDYNIDTENATMLFLRLSFEYPVLQTEILPKELNDLLLSQYDENTKMENLVNQLKISIYEI